jgi:hypothetical protein
MSLQFKNDVSPFQYHQKKDNRHKINIGLILWGDSHETDNIDSKRIEDRFSVRSSVRNSERRFCKTEGRNQNQM